MSRILTIDIGAGTMDVLYYDTDADLLYKAVVRSPVRTIAEAVLAAPGDLLVSGGEMGGGAVTQALRRCATDGRRVAITAAAAMTVSHDLDRVTAMGMEVVDEAEAAALAADGNLTPIVLGDLEPDRIARIVTGFGVPFEFDIVGVCVQDHGKAPPGVSHLDYRHNHFRPLLDATPSAHALLHRDDEVPEDMTRLTTVRDGAKALAVTTVYVMDSGMAAILGATLDPRVLACERPLVLDVATSHTLAASYEGTELAGFLEYHTRDVRVERMDDLLRELANGDVSHADILAEGGHGAYTRHAPGFEAVDIILVTGPKRSLLASSAHQLSWGAPLGDNMMTGTAGLMEAIRRREGWGELPLG